ncbi:hypothetical protein PCANC_05030 [Puccinia coronata f. sp. avenae]|uniref:Uncharacterized protein n=1 Tax=Puccinia coronata f. sp. avenae TaxID=200324 RepID=A0A2N5T749_9BASI|nr:hypothetical protein PCANC_05030 [Puccinia coronata f. sp. avenae]
MIRYPLLIIQEVGAEWDYQWLTLWNSTKLDLLDEFNEIQVGVDCKLDKKTMEYFPVNQGDEENSLPAAGDSPNKLVLYQLAGRFSRQAVTVPARREILRTSCYCTSSPGDS